MTTPNPVSLSVTIADLATLLAHTEDGSRARVTYSQSQLEMANQRVSALEVTLNAIQFNLKAILEGGSGRVLASDEGQKIADEFINKLGH